MYVFHGNISTYGLIWLLGVMSFSASYDPHASMRKIENYRVSLLVRGGGPFSFAARLRIWIAFIVLLINCTSATMECVRRPVTSVAAAIVVLCAVRERGKRRTREWIPMYAARALMGKWQAQQWTPDYLVKNPRRTCMHEASDTEAFIIANEGRVHSVKGEEAPVWPRAARYLISACIKKHLSYIRVVHWFFTLSRQPRKLAGHLRVSFLWAPLPATASQNAQRGNSKIKLCL